MSIKAVFFAGQTKITVNGLHQWDYGRKLEIHASDLPAQVEVHFACLGMREATVRPCAIVNGVGSVTIPNGCLEQTAPIMVWIYAITADGMAGATVKTVVLNVTERARPKSIGPEPEEIPNAYEKLSAEVNKQIAALRAGNVTVGNARNAEFADYARESVLAEAAVEAQHATSADKASALELPAGFVEHTYGEEMESGLYMMRLSMYEREDFLSTFQAVVGVFAVTNASNIYLGELNNGSVVEEYSAYVIDNKVLVYKRDGSQWVEVSTTQGHWCNVMYKKICS